MAFQYWFIRGFTLSCISTLLLGFQVLTAALEPPTFPQQFTVTVEITAHLVDRTKEYPPWLKVIDVQYDYLNKRAYAAVLQGYDEGKVFIRRYDNKTEFMIRSGPYPECQRAYLGEVMPLPTLPSSITFQGLEILEGESCEHWMEDLGSNRHHFYFSAKTRLPLRVTDEQVFDGESVPLMTYEFKALKVGPLRDSRAFDLPEPYHFRACQRNIGGFPYLHIFHHYLRF